jgi:cytochrome c oxidase cbb3-type subunit 3
MRLQLRNKIKQAAILLTVLLLLSATPVWAAGPPEPSVFSNPLAVIMLILMFILLIVIAVLASIVVGAADVKARQRKEEKQRTPVISTLIILLLLLPPTSLMAQDTGSPTANAVVNTIGGMSPTAFYIMAVTVFLELIVILALLLNIKLLIRKEKENLAQLSAEEITVLKKTRLSWWDRFNKFKPASQEAELDLGHEYDGIRELNNRLPPWWLYGFYLTIIFAGVYLWRFHVSHTALSSEEEYVHSVKQAELRIAAHLKAKGEAVDENTVTLLTSTEDLAEGKIVFMKSCASCHKESGAGDVGPNLTDNYWIHGNDMKSIFKTVKYGINAMPQWQNSYSNKQIAQVTSYIKSLKGTNPPNPKAPQGMEVKEEVIKPAADSIAKDENKTVLN